MYQSPFCPLLPIKWKLCKKTLFFFTTCVCMLCVCVLFFSHKPKAKTQNLFFLLGVGGDIICKRDRWWVYQLLIIYTLLLPWQFSTLTYIYFSEMLKFSKKTNYPQITKKFWNKILKHSRKFYLIEIFIQINYLFIWNYFFEACYQGMLFF